MVDMPLFLGGSLGPPMHHITELPRRVFGTKAEAQLIGLEDGRKHGPNLVAFEVPKKGILFKRLL